MVVEGAKGGRDGVELKKYDTTGMKRGQRDMREIEDWQRAGRKGIEEIHPDVYIHKMQKRKVQKYSKKMRWLPRFTHAPERVGATARAD